jgi:hypothetical protein
MQQARLPNIRGRLKATLLCALVVLPPSALALVSFDFETPYLVQPGQQVWDFCLVQQDGQYHAFYHTIPQYDAHPANADTIWHAVSDDLNRWDILGPALTAGPGWWDEVAMWAPDVVFDDMSGRWAMLYTGIATGMVQRACLAWSDDLMTWKKSPANPVFEPDSLTYFWSPSVNWSSFRDPFLYHDGQQWNMLTTAHLRLGGMPGYRRGIVHRAVSPNLESWQDAGVLYEHDGSSGRTNALESVQYLVRNGWHHLFFVEQDPNIEHHPTTHLVASDPAGWTMADKTIIDAGWAPEIEPYLVPSDGEIYARLTKSQDPRDNTWFVTAKFDTIRFDAGAAAPAIVFSDLPGPGWPVRTGWVGAAAPTFGDNAVLRDDTPGAPEGHGWLNTYEFFCGPLSGIGQPGSAQGNAATGHLKSRPFVITGDYFRLLLAGGDFPLTCRVYLADAGTDEVLTAIHPAGEDELVERFWDVRAYRGREVVLVIEDEETAPGGWIAVDEIEEFSGASPVAGSDGTAPALPLNFLAACPNPFNARTEIRLGVEVPGVFQLEIFDPSGRRVWASATFRAAEGDHGLPWDGRDSVGRNLPSGVYFARVLSGGQSVAGTRLTLVK